jgi:hypothetical protein
MIVRINSDYFLNINKLLSFVVETRCVFFEVGTELLDVVQMRFVLPKEVSLYYKDADLILSASTKCKRVVAF